ncbi:MAG: BrnT family toxin [Rhodocyclaceae bacterium]|nr:BrnT family toxin [Rhodocyclaceae bacterium]
MDIEFDEEKRRDTLVDRGLDFARADDVFAKVHFTAGDLRRECPDPRFITVGRLDGRLVVVVCTPRGTARRIISMRKANERERRDFSKTLD